LAARIGLRPDDLWVKRDDWLGLGGGGNKLRKLEFLCAHALEELDATVLVTGGATQSNYCRLTAASARRLGLGVVLVLTGDGPAGAAGNLTLDGLFQADVRWAGEVTTDTLDDMVATVADELRGRGFACTLYHGTYVAQIAEVDVASSGAVRIAGSGLPTAVSACLRLPAPVSQWAVSAMRSRSGPISAPHHTVLLVPRVTSTTISGLPPSSAAASEKALQ